MDESAAELARDWLRRADHDLKAARILATGAELCQRVSSSGGDVAKRWGGKKMFL
jgi:hypothetical protein